MILAAVPPGGTILLPRNVHRSVASALVLSGAVGPGKVRSIVELIGVPTVCEAAGIYNWASDGDVALVDGDHGLVRVNPSRRERDEARAERGGPTGDDGSPAG